MFGMFKLEWCGRDDRFAYSKLLVRTERQGACSSKKIWRHYEWSIRPLTVSRFGLFMDTQLVGKGSYIPALHIQASQAANILGHMPASKLAHATWYCSGQGADAAAAQKPLPGDLPRWGSMKRPYSTY